MKTSIVIVLLAAPWPVAAQDSVTTDPAALAVKVLNEGVTSLDPSDMLAWVELPRSVKKGDSLTLTITVENARKAGDFDLESVDIDGSFLRGFRIESVRPPSDETDDSFDTLTLEYSKAIGPGESLEFVIEMTAVEPGIYIGEVSIWDEEDFLSRYVQCKVLE